MFPEIDSTRRRRRGRLLIPLVLTLLIAAGWWIGTRAEDELTVAAYLEEVRDISDRQAPRAEAFRQLLIDTSALQMERSTFTATIDQLRSGIDADIEELAALEVPQEAFATDQFLSIALERWTNGLGAFRSSALRLPDGADLAARTDVSESLVALRVADAMYAEFQLEALGMSDEIGLGTAPFVDVQYVEASFGTPEGVAQLIQAILDNPDMAPEQELAIVSVGFLPEPVGDTTPEGLEQIPATETVTVTVVVRNGGTDAEGGLEVRLQLETRDGVVEAADVASVGELAAGGGSTAVEFADLPVRDSIGYLLEIELARAGGGTIATDTTEFVVSPASG